MVRPPADRLPVARAGAVAAARQGGQGRQGGAHPPAGAGGGDEAIPQRLLRQAAGGAEEAERAAGHRHGANHKGRAADINHSRSSFIGDMRSGNAVQAVCDARMELCSTMPKRTELYSRYRYSPSCKTSRCEAFPPVVLPQAFCCHLLLSALTLPLAGSSSPLPPQPLALPFVAGPATAPVGRAAVGGAVTGAAGDAAAPVAGVALVGEAVGAVSEGAVVGSIDGAIGGASGTEAAALSDAAAGLGRGGRVERSGTGARGGSAAEVGAAGEACEPPGDDTDRNSDGAADREPKRTAEGISRVDDGDAGGGDGEVSAVAAFCRGDGSRGEAAPAFADGDKAVGFLP